MVKCLTLNTHSWMESDPLHKLQDIVAQILKEDYDIICLQEINQEIVSQPVQELAAYSEIVGTPTIHQDNFALHLVNLLQKQGKTYYWSWAYNHIGYDKYHEGVAILSKTPIKPQAVLVSDVDDEYDYHTRRVLLADTEIDGRALTVVSLHLSWYGKGFEGEWKKLEAELQGQKTPLILMGDYNNPTDEEGYQVILSSSLNLKDSHKSANIVSGEYTIKADIDGWSGNEKNLKVDHAFVSKELEILSSQVVFDGIETPVVSDHFGLAISFK